MLNPEFAQAGWRPDPTIEYRSSDKVKSTGFTYLMALVLSGRDPDLTRSHVLKRQDELDTLLAAPESSELCRQVTSSGFTALMLAAYNSNTDSTEATVAQLLAHESSAQVTRMISVNGFTALTLAAANSRANSTEATVAQLLAHESAGDVARIQNSEGITTLMYAVGNSLNCSTEATVAQLLAHESASEVARMQDKKGWTALTFAAHIIDTESTEATVTQLLLHESGDDVAVLPDRSNATIFTAATRTVFSLKTIRLLIQTACRTQSAAELESLCGRYPRYVASCLFDIYQQTCERQTVMEAFKAGLSLPASTVLTYI
jgi:hypothetical protein